MAASIRTKQVANTAQFGALFYVGIGAAGGLVALLLCTIVLWAVGGGSTPSPAPARPIAQKQPDTTAKPVPPPVVDQTLPTPWPAPTPQPDVTEQPKTKSGIDLIALVTPDNPLNKGKVRKVENRIVTSKGMKWDVAVAPVDVPDAYTIELVATSAERPDSLHLGLLVGGKPSSFIVDGFESSRSGPFVIKGRGMTNPEYPGFKGTLMKINEPIRLKIAVTPRSIDAWADGQQFFAWQGELTEIDWSMTYPYPAQPCLTVGSWNCPFEITEWTMTKN